MVALAPSSRTDMHSAIDHFRAALRGRGIIPPDDLIADGRLRRCDVDGGKHGTGDGAYLLHLDGVPAGGFENWRDGLGWENWKADTGRSFTPEERAAYGARMNAARMQRESETAKRAAEARERAAAIWAASKPGPHPYLERKGVEAYGARVSRDKLVLPVRDAAGMLHSLQFIAPDGGKKFLRGGRVVGCYFGLGGKPAGALCIAEGFATGASVHQATGHPVAVAFNAGNLEPVARALRAKLPAVRLIVCGDDDSDTHGNPGRTKAVEAAQAVDGFVALPVFSKATQCAEVTA